MRTDCRFARFGPTTPTRAGKSYALTPTAVVALVGSISTRDFFTHKRWLISPRKGPVVACESPLAVKATFLWCTIVPSCVMAPRWRYGERTDDLARPPSITEHHSVSSLNDLAREASPCSRYLRPARDVDTTCTVGANVHESMATKVRAHRAPNLLRGCFGRCY
jgi:hypothetical protein